MEIVLNILFVIAGLLVVALIAALFIKKEYEVRQEVVINKPVDEVFQYIKYQKNQDHYSKWLMTDPTARKTFSGEDGQAGFIYA